MPRRPRAASRARSAGDRQHLGRVPGVEAGAGGLGEHRDGPLGIGPPGGCGQDRVAAHHRAAADRDVPGQLVDLDQLRRVAGGRAGLVEQRDGAVGQSGEPARLGRLDAAGAPRRSLSAVSRPARSNAAAAVAYALRSRPAAAGLLERGRRGSSAPAAAAARCHARRSTSRSGRAAASARCASRRCRGRGVGVDRRPGQRMAELDRARAQRDQPRALGRGQRGQVDPELGRGPLEHRQVAAVAASRPAPAPAGRPRRAVPTRRRNAPEIVAETRTGAPSGASARSCASGASSSSASGLPAVAPCSRVDRLGRQAAQQHGRLVAGQAADPQRRQVGAVEQRRLALADRDQHRDRIGHQPAEGEQQRLARWSRRASARRRSAPPPAPARRRRRAG